MIKMVCDKCNKEVNKITRLEHREEAKAHGVTIMSFPIGAYDLCDDCLDKLKILKFEIKDFMEMSDEDIELEIDIIKLETQLKELKELKDNRSTLNHKCQEGLAVCLV